MARRLVHVPFERLDGQTRIEPGYSHGYTEAEMRQWAADLEALERTSPEELARIAQLAPDQRSPEEQRLAAAHAVFYEDPSRGVKGSLRPDGMVELDGGRHRTACAQERGMPAMPVWVSAPDEASLDRLEAASRTELARRRDPMSRTDRQDRSRREVEDDRVRT